VQSSHPTIWKLLDDTKNEITLAEQRVDRFFTVGQAPRRNETYKRRDVIFKNHVSNYGKINDFDYIKNIARIKQTRTRY
jgi:hypothetical protein